MLVHVSTYQGSILGTGFLSHGHMGVHPQAGGIGSDLWPFGCGSKLTRRGKPQVLVHVSTYQASILGSGFSSHSHMGCSSVEAWVMTPGHFEGREPTDRPAPRRGPRGSAAPRPRSSSPARPGPQAPGRKAPGLATLLRLLACSWLLAAKVGCG